MRIFIAESAGVCFGVERALNLSEKALTESETSLQKVSSLGPLIHNPQVVSQLSGRGLQIAENIDDVPKDTTVVFRSHGVPSSTQKKAQELGLKVVDATCPLVKVPQNFARKLSENGYYVVIVGDEKHPEIMGVKSYANPERVAVVKGSDELEKLPQDLQKVGVICQTTLKFSLFDSVVTALKAKYPEVKVHNTICSATRDRQAAAHDLAPKVDAMVVIGGRGSSNTQKLLDICKGLSKEAYIVETPSDLDPNWFIGLESVGLTAGASTPHSMIFAIRDRIADLAKKSNQSVELIPPNWTAESGAH